MREVGKVLWISERDGNGIIIAANGNEYYFDTSVCRDFKDIKRNDIVNFNNDESSGCLVAKQVLKRELKWRLIYTKY